MDECVDSFGEAAIFSTLNANSEYLQVEIEEADRDKLLSSHITDYIGSSVYLFGYATPLAHSSVQCTSCSPL